MINEEIIKNLCIILDNIDTYAELCINGSEFDDKFRTIMHKAQKWHDFVKTDGYNLFLNGEKI